MFGLGHWFEILIICGVALIVFGPKRMIEMGSSLGKALREFRESTKDLNWGSIITGNSDEPVKKTTPSALGALSQFTQAMSSNTSSASQDAETPRATTTPATGEMVVESSPTTASEPAPAEETE